MQLHAWADAALASSSSSHSADWGFQREELPVWPELAEVVDLLWVLCWHDSEQALTRAVHLPPRNEVHLLLHLRQHGRPSLETHGPATRVHTGPPTGSPEIIGVRLRLGAARRILSVLMPGLSLRALVDQPRVLDLEPPRLSAREQRLEWLRRLLREWHARAEAPDPRVARFLASGDRGKLSARQLRRLIQRETGLGPKQLQRTERFHSAFAALAGAPAPGRAITQGMAALAADAGYADQAHFCRDFKLSTSLTPEAWRRRGHAACPFSSSPEELQLATRVHAADRISRNTR